MRRRLSIAGRVFAMVALILVGSAGCVVTFASGDRDGGADPDRGVDGHQDGTAPDADQDGADPCGNGLVEATEGCDDGNNANDDGCSASCQAESGFSCSGEPSVCVPVCGDGMIVGGEGCDDGNNGDGDGCSALCQVESGWECSGVPSECSPIVGDWYDQAWEYRKSITLHAGKVHGDLQDFPVYISLFSDNDLSVNAQADGGDILFTASDGTSKLAHEIVRFRQNQGRLIAWVKVPQLSSQTDTLIYMYYGDLLVADQQDPAGVWTNGFAAVLHLQEWGSGQDHEYQDSTGNGHHGTGGGVAGLGDSTQTPQRTAGIMGFAQQFDDVVPNQQIRLNLVDNTGWTEMTVQAWIQPDDDGDDRLFAKTWSFNPDGASWMLAKQYTNKIRHRTEMEYRSVISGTAFTFGVWAHFAYTWTAGQPGMIRIYRDGDVDQQETISGLQPYQPVPDIEPIIGNSPDGQRGYSGLIQEVRLSSVARSGEWLKTEFENQNAPSDFYTVGAAESRPNRN